MNDNFAPIALVVDDDAIIRLGACDILEDAGFRCVDAATGEEALKLLERHQGEITLLFTDVDLGTGLNGFDLASECSRKWPEIGILVASGGHQPSEEQMPPNSTFVRKPFSAQVVHDRVKQLLPEGQKPEPLKAKSKVQ